MPDASQTTTPDRLPPATTLGVVRLIAGDAAALGSFYERAIGLRPVEGRGEGLALGVDGRPLVELVERPDAPRRPPGTTGLFHLAILVPSRPDLASALRRALEAGTRFTGASDHLVSEALYLRDPEGNGIEIYRDRSREEWNWAGGEVHMDTLPLDLEAVMATLPGDPPPAVMPPQTRIGHVHLNVSELEGTEDFYSPGLGFDVTVRGYPGALFVSSGGYHHHLGLNTWEGPGAPPPPAGARGLDRFEVVLPARADVDQARERLERAGAEPVVTDEGFVVADPSGNRLLVSSAV
jgi:catechol 2,3-dioxygenase